MEKNRWLKSIKILTYNDLYIIWVKHYTDIHCLKEEKSMIKKIENKKRISCPYCSEDILFSAKKCRFCGEWLNKTSKTSSTKKVNHNKFVFIAIVVLLIILFFASSLYASNQDRIRNEKYKMIESNKVKNSPTPIVTATPKLTPAPTYSPSKNTYDPNKPVHCNVHENCGGGTTPLTQQECDNSICCWTYDGYKLMSKDECSVLEEEYKIRADRVPVILGSTTYYCDEGATGALKDAQKSSDAQYDDYVKYCITEKNEELCKSAEASKSYYDNQLNTLKTRHCNL